MFPFSHSIINMILYWFVWRAHFRIDLFGEPTFLNASISTRGLTGKRPKVSDTFPSLFGYFSRCIHIIKHWHLCKWNWMQSWRDWMQSWRDCSLPRCFSFSLREEEEVRSISSTTSNTETFPQAKGIWTFVSFVLSVAPSRMNSRLKQTWTSLQTHPHQVSFVNIYPREII